MRQPIARSSIEFFIAFLFAILMVVWPMTWWLQIILMMVCIGIIIHLINGSLWTYKWSIGRKAFFSIIAVLLFVIYSCNPVIDQWNKDHLTTIGKINFSDILKETLNKDVPLWFVVVLIFLLILATWYIFYKIQKQLSNNQKESSSQTIEIAPNKTALETFGKYVKLKVIECDTIQNELRIKYLIENCNIIKLELTKFVEEKIELECNDKTVKLPQQEHHKNVLIAARNNASFAIQRKIDKEKIEQLIGIVKSSCQNYCSPIFLNIQGTGYFRSEQGNDIPIVIENTVIRVPHFEFCSIMPQSKAKGIKNG